MTALVELHRHLDGSLRPETLRALSADAGFPLERIPAFSPGMGLSAALDCFRVTVGALQSLAALQRVAHECCEDAAAEGVGHLELRFAPQLHPCAPLPDVVDAVLKGVSGRAGVLLCGLYGESPDMLEALVDIARDRPGVVGIDLAGGPLPDHRWGLLDYAPAFQRAARYGLGRTVHAGEGRPAQEIIVAIEQLGAQRIGHGLTVLEDPRATALVRERQVTLEACPTSNWHVGAIPAISAHPLRQWLDAGLRVAVCTDNTLLSQVTLPAELSRIGAPPGSALAARLSAMAWDGRFIRGVP